MGNDVIAPGALRRRLEFLIQEARAADRVKDQAVIKILRSVSNYTTVGADGDSPKVKKLNAWMSRAAYDLALSRASFSAWHKETTNEHEDELSQVWQWIVDHRETVTAEELEARLRSRPYVTVTLAEDMALRKLKRIPLGQRYRRADVLVGKAAGLWNRTALVVSPPEWSPREVSSAM